MSVQVDTLALMHKLEAGGFTQTQANTLAGALGAAATSSKLVTMDDLEQRVTLLEQRLTIRMGGIAVVLAGFLTAVFKFVH